MKKGFEILACCGCGVYTHSDDLTDMGGGLLCPGCVEDFEEAMASYEEEVD